MRGAENENERASHERGLRFIEVMAGFSIGCILVILAIDKLTRVGHVALCMFCVALPILLLIRADGEPPAPYHFKNTTGFVIVTVGVVLDVIGFGLLVWQQLPIAAKLYFWAVVVCMISWCLFGRWHSVKAAFNKMWG
jgi:hypothetical protein